VERIAFTLRLTDTNILEIQMTFTDSVALERLGLPRSQQHSIAFQMCGWTRMGFPSGIRHGDVHGIDLGGG